MGAQTLALGPDRDGRVLWIGDGRVIEPPPRREARAARRLPCPEGGRIRAGGVNAHTHIYSGLAPLGMPPPSRAPQSFVQILERIWWRLDRALDAASLAAAARFYVAEALVAGTTTLVDHHESPELIEGSLDILADACHELGMRAALTFGATERNGGRDEARCGLAECRRYIEADRRPRLRGLVGLHASFTVSDATAREAGELARELGTVCHVHLAEDGADVEDARRRGWPGPLERLLELGALPRGSILAHGVHLSADQVRLAEEHELWLVQNPRSNHGNGVGYPEALAESSRVALGTDGYPARMAEEAGFLFAEASRRGDDPDSVRERTRAGHRLAAELFERPFEPLAPGAEADAVVEDLDGQPHHVVVGGRPVVEDGRLVHADLGAIRTEAQAQAPRLWRRMAALEETG